ncbi:hypothetical protein BKH30_08260 [Actinomyces oris]|uniref:Uncharacterized protein n=1 Tax=Actinomyces oris TaxID=544580 RepID=A0A1Q8VU40_9ACTO|nr:hypothetical protein BKH31_07630 [Actinomyces oris]OLO51619.1 hypothetical protein BKH30_08260 [Actinomyces oris]
MALSAGILTTGLALSGTTASAAEPAAVTASASQANNDGTAPTGVRGWFKQQYQTIQEFDRAMQRAFRQK